ncbi:MAG: 16S rRNA (cytidine(1402)-2'-O)-methyltransferase [Gammaproteobacteria bacterium]|nr:16S rRNA (cytidine(1402)-2'-O)-methyltransferase [Gammaproteobacteria bacterium]
MSNQSGCLYVVATPIGNLKDMSPRAVEILAEVALILAEDTRHSRPLLIHFGIGTPLQSLHEHNEVEMAPVLCERILRGESMALISDAGTPLVSDPGYALLRQAHDMGVTVSPIPGASAMIAALSVAGLPSDRFAFEGFLPAKSSGRQQRLQGLAAETRTLIFYESPHRIIDSLRDMVTVLGADRLACMGRELTKRFETIRRAPLGELLTFVEGDDNQQKGEFVLMLAGAPEVETDEASLSVDRVLDVLLEELSTKQAAALAAKLTGRKKNEVYQRALAKRGEN